MRRRSLSRRLLPPVLVVTSVLVGIGCGVLNPDLLGTVGANAASGVINKGNVVILVMNDTAVTAQANVTVTKINGSQLVLNVPVPANDHVAVVQDCDVDTITVDQASVAGTNGAVVIPATVSPVKMGQTLQCGGVMAISITGTAPGVFLNAQTF